MIAMKLKCMDTLPKACIECKFCVKILCSIGKVKSTDYHCEALLTSTHGQQDNIINSDVYHFFMTDINHILEECPLIAVTPESELKGE